MLISSAQQDWLFGICPSVIYNLCHYLKQDSCQSSQLCIYRLIFKIRRTSIRILGHQLYLRQGRKAQCSLLLWQVLENIAHHSACLKLMTLSIALAHSFESDAHSLTISISYLARSLHVWLWHFQASPDIILLSSILRVRKHNSLPWKIDMGTLTMPRYGTLTTP